MLNAPPYTTTLDQGAPMTRYDFFAIGENAWGRRTKPSPAYLIDGL
jgi:hypothetical protein